jgi:hypothetical protein
MIRVTRSFSATTKGLVYKAAQGRQLRTHSPSVGAGERMCPRAGKSKPRGYFYTKVPTASQTESVLQCKVQAALP